MIELLRKNGLLYVQVVMNLRLPITYKNEVFEKGKQEKLLLPEAAMYILARNGNLQIWNGKKYIKLHLGDLDRIMNKKDYIIKDYVEPKKEVPKVEPKVEEKPVEQPKVEPKQEEVKKEQPKKEESKQQNDNKKQRHNNNNKQQGGDK